MAGADLLSGQIPLLRDQGYTDTEGRCSNPVGGPVNLMMLTLDLQESRPSLVAQAGQPGSRAEQREETARGLRDVQDGHEHRPASYHAGAEPIRWSPARIFVLPILLLALQSMWQASSVGNTPLQASQLSRRQALSSIFCTPLSGLTAQVRCLQDGAAMTVEARVLHRAQQQLPRGAAAHHSRRLCQALFARVGRSGSGSRSKTGFRLGKAQREHLSSAACAMSRLHTPERGLYIPV